MKKVFVIIVTYKGKQWYDKCFESLRKSSLPVQTIVVDNTPGEEDAEYIKSHYPEIHLIKTNDNLGFGKANNIAMRFAYDNGCDYAFLLNQDTWLIKEDTIEQLAQIAEQHPEFGILSPMHVMADGKTMNMDYEYEPGRCSRRLAKDLYSGSLQDVYDTDYVNAAAWLIPRRIIETVGGFDPLFRQYGEDDDYMNRVRYHKFKIGICPKMALVHDHTADTWSEEGKTLFRKANKDHLEKYLNINKGYNYLQLRWMYLKRLVKAYISRNKYEQDVNRHAFVFLRKNNKRIQEHREQNQQIGMSWI